jgi:hypothetical protein
VPCRRPPARPGPPAPRWRPALAGATTAGVAEALGIGRAAARDALTALETAGIVTRTKGGKPGIPDTWTLTAAGPAAHEPGTGPTPDDQAAASTQPGDDARLDQDGPGEQQAAGGTGQQEASGGEPDTATRPQQGEDYPAGDAEPGTGGTLAAGDSGSAGSPTDAALAAEITGRIGQIQAAAPASDRRAGGREPRWPGGWAAVWRPSRACRRREVADPAVAVAVDRLGQVVFLRGSAEIADE